MSSEDCTAPKLTEASVKRSVGILARVAVLCREQVTSQVVKPGIIAGWSSVLHALLLHELWAGRAPSPLLRVSLVALMPVLAGAVRRYRSLKGREAGRLLLRLRRFSDERPERGYAGRPWLGPRCRHGCASMTALSQRLPASANMAGWSEISLRSKCRPVDPKQAQTRERGRRVPTCHGTRGCLRSTKLPVATRMGGCLQARHRAPIFHRTGRRSRAQA